MAHHQSAKKRIRQNIKRRAHNRTLRSALRTSLKQFREILESGDAGQAQTSYPGVQHQLDKAVTKGILHRGTAARYKSRLARALSKLPNTDTLPTGPSA